MNGIPLNISHSVIVFVCYGNVKETIKCPFKVISTNYKELVEYASSGFDELSKDELNPFSSVCYEQLKKSDLKYKLEEEYQQIIGNPFDFTQFPGSSFLLNIRAFYIEIATYRNWSLEF
ncbi:hypothetical protein HZS_5962 [Henneguya salminicola]|nr:hypothetical protein HZS_5962 [Henneguya salminicola]